MSVVRVVVAALFASALTAYGQAADGGVVEAKVVPDAVKPEAVKPEAPKEPPQLIRVYGVLKPTVVFSSGAVESYSQPNATASTAAGNPIISSVPGAGRLSFQVGQSRFGLQIGEGTPFRGQIEFDFLDFTKASPTLASVPRLRIAKVAWLVSDKFTLSAGQDWDVTQPVNPHGNNWVGGLFQAGNSAFMRQQVKAIGVVGDFELAGAVGLQNNNNTAKDGLVEIGLVPTFAMHAQLNLGPNGKVGLSGLATSITYKAGTADQSSTFAGLAGLYGDVTFSGVNLRAEAYIAKNAANLYLLTLSQGRAGAGKSIIDEREVGGFLSLRLPAGPVGIYGMLGGATLLNPENATPSYNYGTAKIDDPSNLPASSSAALAGTGPGMLWNTSGRIGFDVKIWKGLTFNFEGFWLRTQHVLMAIDVARAPRGDSISSALGLETGFIYTF